MHPAIRRGAELKNCATSKISSEHRRAVDVAGAVRLQIGVGVFAPILLKAKNNVGRHRSSRGNRQDERCSHRNGADTKSL